MSHKNKKLSPKVSNTALVVFVGVAIGVFVYYLFVRSAVVGFIQNSNTNPLASHIVNPYVASPVSTTSSVATTTASSGPGFVSTPYDQTNTSDPRSWPTFSSYELGFRIKYPSDLTVDNSDPKVFKVTFPQSYFSTQMSDSDSVSVTVNATCTPVTSFSDKGDASSTMATITNSGSGSASGINFILNTQYDMGAGSHDAVSIYDTVKNNSCYRITVASRGPNSAGLFTGDAATMAAMDAAHSADAAKIGNIEKTMLSTFAFVNTPDGQNEADFSGASQTTAPADSISLTNVSPSPVSIGSLLTINGKGFLGHDTVVWVSNGSVKGVLWGGMPKNDTYMSVTIPARACTIYNGASGLPCPSYLIMNPGLYSLTVSNQNGTTDSVYFRVQ